MLRIIASCLLFSLSLSTAVAGVMDTVAGTGQREDNGAEGPAARINVGDPFGVEIGPDGALYICEVANHRIRRLDRKTNHLTTVAGCGQRGYSGDGGPATAACMNEPYEVRFDGDGNLYVVEMRNHVVRRIDAKSGIISTVAGTGQPGFGGDGGPATEALLRTPHSIALDRRGGLYIADIGNHRIRRVDLAANTIETVAGNGVRELPTDGSLAQGRPMLGPRALFIDGDVLWIALREGHSIWSMDLQSGRLAHRAGSGRKGYSGDGGPAKQATFNGPKGIAVGAKGKVFVADTENHVIRMVDPRQSTVATVVGNGQRGFAGDGGPATQATMDRPHGICVDEDGSLYIGDTLTHRVRRVSP